MSDGTKLDYAGFITGKIVGMTASDLPEIPQHVLDAIRLPGCECKGMCHDRHCPHCPRDEWWTPDVIRMPEDRIRRIIGG
jgi:hypothetical protein